MTQADKKILILGAGKIGSLIACLFSQAQDYQVYLADQQLDSLPEPVANALKGKVELSILNAKDGKQLAAYIERNGIGTILSSLPYNCNKLVAKVAAQNNTHYFDLTEDVEVTLYVSDISQGCQRAFVPQCGLAPGFISIVANALMSEFEKINVVKMRVGALPVNPNNALKYSLTWSTDGLINEYGNLCYGIEDGEMTTLMPLEGYETITVDGLLYEAFNTSGGLGSLAETYAQKVKTMNYKTLRYPGHCEKIKLLMNDLKLNDDRDTLKRILERSIPKTKQDVVLIYVSVAGLRDRALFEENYVKKIYPTQIGGIEWSAIQVTTAAGICAVVDLVMENPEQYHGLVRQEDILLSDFLSNRFGKYYAQ